MLMTGICQRSVVGLPRRLIGPMLLVSCVYLITVDCGCNRAAERPTDGPQSTGGAAGGGGPAGNPGGGPNLIAAVVETRETRTETIGVTGGWKSVPEYFAGAAIQKGPLEPATRGDGLACTVKTAGVVVVATSQSQTGPQIGPAAAPNGDDLPGWIAVGRIRWGDAPGSQERTLFRREFQAGEKLEFRSPHWSLPYLVLLNDDQARQVREQPELIVPLYSLAYLTPPIQPPGPNAKSANDVMMLNTHEVGPTTPGSPILERELARQAFLLAAREELGLATRDKSLREAFPPEADPAVLPFDILFTRVPGEPVRVMVFRQQGKGYEVLWQKQLKLPIDHHFEDLVTQCEALSRTDFVDVMKRAGMQPRPRPVAADERSEPTDIQPPEWNVIAQFASLRRLHATLRTHGETPALLAALARAYADIGAETAFLWSPAHKVFEARALLYAERLVQRAGADQFSLWNRAYVRALVGRHAAALDDLAKAAPAGEPIGNKPEWVELIRAHCEFDQDALNVAKASESVRPLAAYLRMLGQEFTKSIDTRMASAGKALELSPDSFRAVDLVADHGPLGISRAAGQRASHLFTLSLNRRLGEVPGLPHGAAELVATGTEGDENPDLAAEMQARHKLTDLLEQAARSPTDRDEPSLAVLAALIRETDFVHGWRMVDFDAFSLSVPADETIDFVWPLVERHPYAKYVESLRSDKTAAAARLKELAASIDTSELELTEERMLAALGQTSRGNQEAMFYWLAFFRYDEVYRDLARIVLVPESNYQLAHQGALKETSPDAPLIVAGAIVAAESVGRAERALEQGAGWEKKYRDDASVLGALSDLYAKYDRLDNALRVAERAFVVSSDIDTCLRLARLYRKKKDIKRWRDTLDNYLERESVGLEHSRIHMEIASYFITEKQWDEALPYALKAAATGSGLGLMTAHQCYDGMKDWKQAEAYVRACSERYPTSSFEWYFWCRRTGRGNAEAARRLAAAYFATLPDPPPQYAAVFLATFQLLCGEQESALQTFSRTYHENFDPSPGLMAALIAHDLGRADVRDRLLFEVEGNATFKLDNRVRTELLGMAQLIRVQLAAGKNAAFDEKGFEQLVKEAPPGDPTSLHYFAGRVLSRQGETEEAHRHLMWTATSPILKLARTLAAAALIEANIEIGDIRAEERESEPGPAKAE